MLELVGSDDVEEDTSFDTILKERLVFGGVFLCIFYVNYNNINKQIKGMRKKTTSYMPNFQEYYNKNILPKLRKK